MNVLLDMDIVAYRAAAAAEEVTIWEHPDSTGYGVASVYCDLDNAMSICRNIVAETLKLIGENLTVGKVYGCYSCPTSENFRREYDEDYKMNRKGVAKPVGLGALRRYLIEGQALKDLIGIAMEDTLEADDLMGILSAEDPENHIIVSDDKDLRTVPTWHAKFPRDHQLKIERVTEEEANWFLLEQTITGDDTDGIKGLKGYGPKTAQKFLAKFEGDIGAATEGARELYAKQFGEEGHAEFLKANRLVYILRSPEDFDNIQKGAHYPYLKHLKNKGEDQ